MVNRKYLAEGGLELFSSGATMIQPTDIYHLAKDDDIREAFIGCNIYIVARRRRISIATDSLRIENQQICGDFLVQYGHGYERFPFRHGLKLANNITSVAAPGYPQDGIYYKASTGETVRMPIFRFMADCEYDLDENDDLEVLYVGKGYGKNGERLALDRLQHHEKLQRILADTLHEQPDHEVLLLLFRYEHYKNHSSSAGDFSVEPTATEEEDSEYLLTVMNAKFSRRNRVLLAEAGLIRYFEPKYNKIYKKTFPSKKHKVLEELLELDFSGLTVQIDTGNIKTNLVSDKAPSLTGMFAELHPYVHIAKIPLYSQEERESFLHAHL